MVGNQGWLPQLSSVGIKMQLLLPLLSGFHLLSPPQDQNTSPTGQIHYNSWRVCIDHTYKIIRLPQNIKQIKHENNPNPFPVYTHRTQGGLLPKTKKKFA